MFNYIWQMQVTWKAITSERVVDELPRDDIHGLVLGLASMSLDLLAN